MQRNPPQKQATIFPKIVLFLSSLKYLRLCRRFPRFLSTSPAYMRFEVEIDIKVV